MDQLKNLAREVGDSCKLPANCPFAKTPWGSEDIGMYTITCSVVILLNVYRFDFSRKLISLHPEKFVEPADNNTSGMFSLVVQHNNILQIVDYLEFW